VHHKVVGDKRPEEVIQKCKYECNYHRYYTIVSSYTAQMPAVIITSNHQSFMEFLDPKMEAASSSKMSALHYISTI
jgi:hypothetical protein